MDFCFIHAADLHLDTPFQGVSQASAEVAAELRDASLKALDGLVDLVLERDAAFLLLAGDIYDLEDRSQRANCGYIGDSLVWRRTGSLLSWCTAIMTRSAVGRQCGNGRNW